MALVSHKILFKLLGENATSASDPIKVYLDGEVDLETEEDRCISSDNDGLIRVKVYSVGDVALPAWLTPEEWILEPSRWSFLWGIDERIRDGWPESWQRGVSRMGEAQKFACARLLCAKLRSQFRISLKGQLVTWLETLPSARQHPSPFSRRQWDALIDERVAREARNLASKLYAHLRYHEHS